MTQHIVYRKQQTVASNKQNTGAKRTITVLLLALTACFSANISTAQNVDTNINRAQTLPDIEVLGNMKPISKVSLNPALTAAPASVTIVGKSYIAKQAYTSYGDLLRPIVGVNVSNYQLGGVGYGIQMRGYVVTEHARDIAFFIDGAPQNQGSSIQANGYTDLNMLIPENIQSIEVIRGPFNIRYGDHALGGGISFNTADRLPSSITLRGGTYGNLRGLVTYGFGNDRSGGYVTIEGGRTNGYRDNSKEKHLNGMAKYSFPLFKGTASIRAQAFGSDFGGAAYLLRDKVDSGLVSKTAAVNNTDGGSTNQQNLVFNYKGKDTANFASATFYVQHHDFIRIRTGTVGGPQRKERDNRVWTGFDLRHNLISNIGKMPVMYMAGLYFRADFANEARFATMDRNELSQNRERKVRTYTPAAYAEMQLKPVEKLKVTLGLRYDQLFYDITTGSKDAGLPDTSLSPTTNAFSPKIGLAYQIGKVFSVFANAAQGFKSPSGYEENIFNVDLKPSKLKSFELGFSVDEPQGIYHALLSGYISDQTGEIQEDPLGNLINFGQTRRSGIEAEARINFEKAKGLAIYGNYSRLFAKLRNGAPTDEFVTNTPVYLALIGIDYDFGAARQANNRVVVSLYDQFVGEKNLNTDGTIQSNPFQRLSGKITYGRQSWANFKVYVQGSFYPGTADLDEASFLSGGNLLTAPQAPATVDLGVRIPF